MALRESDAYKYLALKQQVILSDCNAVIQTGPGCFEYHPVYIRKVNDKTEFLVDINEQFLIAQSIPGFVNWQKVPPPIETSSEPAITSETVKLGGSNWQESRAFADAEAKTNLAARQNSRRETNGIGITSNKWQAFSDAATRQRNANFTSR